MDLAKPEHKRLAASDDGQAQNPERVYGVWYWQWNISCPLKCESGTTLVLSGLPKIKDTTNMEESNSCSRMLMNWTSGSLKTMVCSNAMIRSATVRNSAWILCQMTTAAGTADPMIHDRHCFWSVSVMSAFSFWYSGAAGDSIFCLENIIATHLWLRSCHAFAFSANRVNLPNVLINAERPSPIPSIAISSLLRPSGLDSVNSSPSWVSAAIFRHWTHQRHWDLRRFFFWSRDIGKLCCEWYFCTEEPSNPSIYAWLKW